MGRVTTSGLLSMEEDKHIIKLQKSGSNVILALIYTSDKVHLSSSEVKRRLSVVINELGYCLYHSLLVYTTFLSRQSHIS